MFWSGKPYLCTPQFDAMNEFVAYQIPFLGLKPGIHSFDFELDDSFFASFEHSEIERADIKADVKLDKQSTMLVLDFHLTGTVGAICDRCGGELDVQIDYTDRLIVKYGEVTGNTDDEIFVLGPSEHLLKLHQYLYEYAHLALPSKTVHPTEEECDQDALNLLDDLRPGDDEDDIDPRWEALKGLK